MNEFFTEPEIRWSDLDPNFHLRHSVYYDFGAYTRVEFLTSHAITPAVMSENNIGPILFREECVFKRELRFGDKIKVDLKLAKSTYNFSRWTMVHEIWRNTDTLSAIITIDGAWMDTIKRKLVMPPEIFRTAFEAIPKTEDFASS
ncbi:MAG: acyl-CoA thioesterase [Ginsengibacter sp.]